MKTGAFILLLFSCTCALAQHDRCTATRDSVSNVMIVQFPEVAVQPAGGMSAFGRAVMKDLKYPSGVDHAHFESKIVVAFVIDANGKLMGERIIRSIEGTDLAEQLIRSAKKISWTPARCRSKAVASVYVMPLQICLQQ